MADNSEFKVALSIEVDKASTQSINSQLTNIQKTLAPMAIKINIDFSQFNSQISKLQTQIDSLTNKKVANQEKEMRVNTQSHTQAMAYLKAQQAEIQKIHGTESKLQVTQNPNTKQITGAIISFKTEIGEAQSKLFSLNEQVKKFVSTGESLKIIKLQPVSDKLISDIPRATAEMDKLISSTQKVSDTIKNKLNNITIGKEWIKDLSEFKNVQDMLQSFDPSSMKMLSKDAYDISQAFKSLQTTVNQVKIGEVVTADFNKAKSALDKFKSSMGGKITGIEMGTTNWATNLAQFDQLKVKFNELQNFKLDANNMNTYMEKVKELNSLYSLTTQEIKRVDNMQKEMTASSKFDSGLTNKIKDYNSQLDIMAGKNEQIKNNPLFRQIQNDINNLKLTPMAQMSDATKNIDTNMKQLKATMISTTTSGVNGFGKMVAMATGFYGLTSVFMKLRSSMNEMVTGLNDMNKGLTDIQIVTGMSSENADKLATSYNKLGKELGATTRELLTGATAWFRQGKSVSEVQELVTASIIQSKLANIDSAQSTEYLTSTLNGYQLEANKAISVIDKMVAIDNSASTSVAELAEALQMSSNSARMAGVELDTLLGYVGTVSAVTRKSASQIGNSFKTIFARYQDIKIGDFLEDGIGVAEIEKVMNKVGITIKKNATEFRDFSDVIDDLSGKWGTLNQVEQSAIAKSLSGIRQRENFIVLMNNMEKAVELTSTSLDSQGLSLDRYNIYLESTEAILNKFKVTMESVWMTTLDSNTIQGVIKFGTAILELTDACGGLIPVVTGVATSFVAFKLAMLFLNNTNATSGILGMISGLLKYKATVDLTTGSVVSLGLASKLLIGGAIIAGVMAMAYGLNYLSKSAERAKEKVETLSSELKVIKNNTNTIKDLGNEYETLAKKGSLNADEAERFTQVQNELKEILPTITGYYDKQGNFIVTQVENAKELLKIQEKLLEIQQKSLQEASRENNNNLIKEHEKKKKQIDDLVRYEELKTKKSTPEKLTSMEQKEFEGLQSAIGMIVTHFGDVKEEIKSLNGEISILSQDMINAIFNIIAPMEEWKSLSDEQENAIRKFISGEDIEQIKLYSNALANGALSTSDFIDGILNVPSVVNDITTAINKKSEAIKQGSEEEVKSLVAFDKILSSLDGTNKTTIDGVKELNQAINSLNEKQTLTSDTILSLMEKYPKLREEVKLVNGVYTLSVDALEKVKSASIEEQRVAIQAQINKTKEVYADTLKRIELYKAEIGAIKTLAQAQMAMSKQQSSYYGDYFGNYGSGKTTDRNLELEKDLGQSIKMFSELEKLEQRLQDLQIGTSVGNTKSGSGIKGDKAKSAKDTFDKLIAQILSSTNEVERAIEVANQKIEMAQKVGDTKSVESGNKNLILLYEQRKTLITKQADALRKLLTQTSDVEIKANINSSIQDLQDKFHDIQMQQVEDRIKAVNKAHDSRIEQLDEEMTLLEQRRILMDEDSPEYKQSQKDELTNLFNKQISSLEAINKLRAQGYSDESDDIEKLKKEWTGYETSRLNLLKSIGEANKALEISNMEKAKKSLDTLLDTTIKMLKQRYDDEKKMIQENSKEKEDAIKKEIDGYKAIINAKKKMLSDEKDSRGYQQGLDEKQKSIGDIQNRLDILSKDDSDKSKAEYKKLYDELLKQKKDLDNYQYDYSIDLQQKALDEELTRYENAKNAELQSYKNQKDAELKILSDYTAKEGNLRKEAMELIKGKSKSFYEDLMAWNSEYGDASSATMVQIWEDGYSAMDTYNGGLYNILDTITLIANKMEAVRNAPWTDFTGGLDTNIQKVPDKNVTSPTDTKKEQSSKAKEQLNQQKYLHDQMVKAQAEKNSGLIKWIEEERKKWGGWVAPFVQQCA